MARKRKVADPDANAKRLDDLRAWRLQMRESRKRRMQAQNDSISVEKEDAAEQGKASNTKQHSVNRQVENGHVLGKRAALARDLPQVEVQSRPKKKLKKRNDKEPPNVSVEQHLSPEVFKVVVAGLTPKVKEEDLRREFTRCGEILSVRLPKERDTGKIRGFAFISFANQAGLQAALDRNGMEFQGRSLFVQEANAEHATANSIEFDHAKGKGKRASTFLRDKPDGCTSVIAKGLSYSVTEADLMSMFKSCGEGPSHVKLLVDRETGASRGMAFIDFTNGAAVDLAIKLDGSELKGRRLSMDYAAPRERCKDPGHKPAGCTAILVKGLAYSVVDADLKDFFKRCGAGPSNVRMVLDKATGESRGMAFVDFASSDAVDEAIQLHGSEFKGRRLVMDYASHSGSSAVESSQGGEKKTKGPGKKPPGCTSVAVKGLAISVTAAKLMKLFKRCGEGPRNANLVVDKETGQFTGTAFVNFSTEEAVDTAMEFNGHELGDQVISINYVKPNQRKMCS